MNSNLTISIYLIKIKHKILYFYANFKFKWLSLEKNVREKYKLYFEISPNNLNF